MRYLTFLTSAVISLCVLGVVSIASAADQKPLSDRDILIADFEGEDYGDWTVQGEAFGTRPAVANVSPGNRVTGHWGKGLVNSYLGGDPPVGKLISPPFTVQRPYVNFLIGAGNHESETCINLLVDGKVVRTAVGPALKNDKGEEVLDWYGWDVTDLMGKTVTLQIVDNALGRLGTHQRRSDLPVRRASQVDRSQLHPGCLPGPHLARPSLHVRRHARGAGGAAQRRIRCCCGCSSRARRWPGDPYRPIYHYVNPEGSLNDPNGLCFWQGRWHLFYQAYPPEDPRQHWGHAVSDDLIHWRDLPLAIYPNPEDKCYSGATLVEEDRVIAMYHGTQRRQHGGRVQRSAAAELGEGDRQGGDSDRQRRRLAAAVPRLRSVHLEEGRHVLLAVRRHPAGPRRQARCGPNFLFRSKDLANWEYLHPFVEDDRYSLVGDDGACPYFWPIGDRHILLHFSHMSGGKYLLGDYDTERDKFVVTCGGEFQLRRLRSPAASMRPRPRPTARAA